MHFPKSHSTCIGCLDSFSSIRSSIYHILLQCLWMYEPEPMDFKGLFYFALLPIMPFDFVLLYMVVKTSSDATYTYDALEWLSLINSSLDALHCSLLILYALQCSLFVSISPCDYRSIAWFASCFPVWPILACSFQMHWERR